MKLVPYHPPEVCNFEVCSRGFFFNLCPSDYGTQLDTSLYAMYVNHTYKINSIYGPSFLKIFCTYSLRKYI